MQHPHSSTSTWWSAFEQLHGHVGCEMPMDHLTRAIYTAVRGVHAPLVGALQVTCADECEIEAAESFQKHFVQYLCPRLKFSHQAPFRLANLGARYEWGAARIAEAHFADAVEAQETHKQAKVLLIKINAHSAVEHDAKGPRFGRMLRYRAESDYCGALHAMLAGHGSLYTDELRLAFSCEGIDRLTPLHDGQRIPARHRMLFAALVSARIQARRAVLDVQDHRPLSPTRYLVLPCVTLNRPKRDTEILVGVYGVDRGRAWHSQPNPDRYCGLGDDPTAYRLQQRGPELVSVEDDQRGKLRSARDHRQLIQLELNQQNVTLPQDHRLERLSEQAATRKHHHDPPYARVLLKSLVRLVAELNPITAVLMLFGEGLAEIHHAHRVHRLARGLDGDSEARALLRDIEARIEHLPPRRAAELVDALAASRVVRGRGG